MQQLSHPVWVRGLKHMNLICLQIYRIKSHPVWVRGLKQGKDMKLTIKQEVAPRVGAWIETWLSFNKARSYCVAPRVGAWIETGY